MVYLLLAGGLTLPQLAAAPAPFPVHPRTPMQWGEPACMTVVDRSLDPFVSLSYQIPYEDLDVPPEEVADSRTHQFLAFCRDSPPFAAPPAYITVADVGAAVAKNLESPNLLLDEESTLETGAAWGGCWSRITADEARRPISFAAAMEPVLWDTSNVPTGAYKVSGYVWEPPLNLWVKRGGVIHVVDDPDPAASPPALAITNHEEAIVLGESLILRGCLRAMPGATMTAAWAIFGNSDEYDWHEFVADVPISGESFELEFVPTAEIAGKLVALRVELRDPQDRRYTAYMPQLLGIIPPSLCDHFACPTTGSDESSGSSGGSSGETSDTGGVDTEPAGCACASTSSAAALPPWLVLLLVRRRPRRHAVDRPPQHAERHQLHAPRDSERQREERRGAHRPSLSAAAGPRGS